MSSKAGPQTPKTACSLGLVTVALFSAAPVAAQDDPAVTTEQDESAAVLEESAPPAPTPVSTRRQFDRIDLTVTVPKNESDQLLEEDCEEEADAGRIAGEIVVCRQLGEATDGSWNKEEFERRYAERTKGGSTPDTFGIPNHGNAIGFGSVPPPALIIDVEALPDAPEGSDADRISRGLPPLGRDPEPTAEEIARRRRELGLEAPPVPEG